MPQRSIVDEIAETLGRKALESVGIKLPPKSDGTSTRNEDAAKVEKDDDALGRVTKKLTDATTRNTELVRENERLRRDLSAALRAQRVEAQIQSPEPGAGHVLSVDDQVALSTQVADMQRQQQADVEKIKRLTYERDTYRARINMIRRVAIEDLNPE